jgi:TonB family protein
MSPIFELEEAVETLDATPRLLVEWPSRWGSFVSSIKPALARSEARLAGETPFGLIPFRIMIPSYLLEAFLILSAIFVKAKIDELRPFVVTAISSHDVIYYTGDELPRTPDLGGAEAGRSGEAGGDEAHHPTQTIKVARGGSHVPEVVDAPDLKLPASRDAVANLVAIRSDPGPPPSEGLRSTRSTPRLNPPLIAPSPEVIRDYTRNAIRLDPVAAPPASLTRNQPLASPNLDPAVVPPAPSVASDHTLVAPALAPNVIPPAPTVSRDHPRATPALDPSVAPPTENVRRDPSRAAPALAANVVPPAPVAVSRQFSAASKQSMDPAVVPPPVSAPERGNLRDSKLSLPAVEPPPPSGSSSFVGRVISRIFGPTEVVAPPPVVAKGTGGTSRPTLPDQVTPPPASLSSSGTGGTGTATRSAAPYVGNPSVVPPPPTLAENGRGTGKTGGAPATAGGRILAENVVPPPSSLGGDPAATGSGLGRKGSSLGAPADITNGGSGKDSGTVMSSQPGKTIGVPPDPKTGSLAMSPAGDKSGSGGTGGGAGIGRGTGPGSGMTGTGTGAGKTDTGHGSDPSARAGISGSNGPGGAGNLASGRPPVQGVDIQGGNGIVTLPSFGGPDSSGNDSATPGRSRLKTNKQTLDLDVVASAGAGGAFAPYKNLFHSETHTLYIDTNFGTVVMEYADESGTSHSLSAPLSPPAALETDLPDGLPQARMVVTCTLNPSGNLTNLHVLEPGPPQMTARVLAALPRWKFQPAMRNNRAVEVTAILGFGIDTTDHF